MKPIKAWAVVNKRGKILRPVMYVSYEPYEIYPTKGQSEGSCFVLAGEKVIRVEIREVKK